MRATLSRDVDHRPARTRASTVSDRLATPPFVRRGALAPEPGAAPGGRPWPDGRRAALRRVPVRGCRRPPSARSATTRTRTGRSTRPLRTSSRTASSAASSMPRPSPRSCRCSGCCPGGSSCGCGRRCWWRTVVWLGGSLVAAGVRVPAGGRGAVLRQRPPAAGGGHRARLRASLDLVVRAPDQGHAGGRPGLVRGATRMAEAGDRVVCDGSHRGGLLADRPGSVGRVVRAAGVRARRDDAQRRAAGAADLLRLPVALVLVAWGARTDRRWTVPVAALLALPVIWLTSLSMLAALVPLGIKRESTVA